MTLDTSFAILPPSSLENRDLPSTGNAQLNATSSDLSTLFAEAFYPQQ